MQEEQVQAELHGVGLFQTQFVQLAQEVLEMLLMAVLLDMEA
jgi:hypothetical protein